MVIEIENKHGETIMAIEVKHNRIVRMFKCEVADEDKDYIFNSKQKLFRVQSLIKE